MGATTLQSRIAAIKKLAAKIAKKELSIVADKVNFKMMREAYDAEVKKCNEQIENIGKEKEGEKE